MGRQVRNRHLAVHHEPVVGIGRRLGEEPLAHARHEGRAQALHPVQPLAAAGPGGEPCRCHLDRDIDQDREISRHAVGGPLDHLAQGARVEAAPVALIGDRRARVAVAHDPFTGGQRRRQHLPHVLGPIRRHQQRFGSR